MRLRFYTILLFYILSSTVVLSWIETNRSIDLIKMTPPELPGKPTPGIDDINKAIKAFNIKVPKSVAFIAYESGMFEEAGVCMVHPFLPSRVYIGPGAFESWAWLAATISHEVEVHANQNWFVISLMETLGMRGIDWAEYSAYNNDLINRFRFGLTDHEVLIRKQYRDEYAIAVKERR